MKQYISSAHSDAWLMVCRQTATFIHIMHIIIVIIFAICQVRGLLKENVHIREQFWADKGVV